MQKRQSQNKEISKRIGRNVHEAPMISIVIPAFNTAEYIAETLESAFGQTFRDFEVIVVNDGSPDTEQLEKTIEPRLEDIVYIIQPNAGAAIARNTALDNVRGEFIAFLDSDDIWFPDFLDSQMAFLESGGYDMVYCDAELFGSDLLGRTFMEYAPSNGEANVESLLDVRCNVITSGTIVRTKTVVDAGRFENDRLHGEDFHLWLRIAKNGCKIGYQRKQLLKYRVRLDGFSGDLVTRARRSIQVYERALRTIDLTDEQSQIAKRMLRRYESDLAVAEGKVLMLSGNFREAANAFGEANSYRPSAKLAAILLLARFAPRMLLRMYRSRRPAEIDFLPNSEKSA